MPRRLVASLALTAALALGGAFAAGAGAAPIRVVRPATDEFFATAPVTVELRTAKSVRSLSARVGGKNVSGAFRRTGGTLWRARLGARQLKGGKNLLVASAVGSSGKRAYTSIRFVLGRRRPSLLTVEGPKRRGPMVARVHLLHAVDRLSAKLNGKRVSWPFGLIPAKREILRLGADDGLHYGTNHLRVTAIRADGDYDVESQKVFVPRTGPVAGAGTDRSVVAGQSVKLDGTSSLAATTPASELTYSWKVVGKPLGSTATLLQTESPRPILQTELPGAYQVQLQVLETAPSGEVRTASDLTTVTSPASVPPIGEPIETMATNGKGESGIQIGETLYPMERGKEFQMVLLNRQTLGFLGAASYTNGEAKKAVEAVRGAGNETLVALSVPEAGEGVAAGELVGLARSLGVEVKPIESGRIGWSVVGIPGTKEGGYLAAGASPGSPRGNLSGYLQETTTVEERSDPKEVVTTEAFGFVPGGRFLFETDAPAPSGLHNTIKVGSRSYESAAMSSCATGGFQVQVVLAETLAPAGGGTFATNGCATATNAAELQNMTNLLNGISTGGSQEGPKLVFVQTIGNKVAGPGEFDAWIEAGKAMERLGGTASVFDIPTASIFETPFGYSFVGEVGVSRMPLTEASQNLTGRPAELSGVLKQNRVGSYFPALSGQTPGSNFQLSAIAYQRPEAWPESQSPGDKAVLKYIAEDLLHLEKPTAENACYVPAEPDVRSEYCNTTYRTSWQGWEGKIRNAKFPAGEGFGRSEWEKVTKQLLSGEMEDVQLVWTYIEELQKVFGLVGVSGEFELKGVVSSIEASIQPKSEISGWFLGFLGSIEQAGEFFALGSGTQKVLAIFQSALLEGASAVVGKSGDPLLENFQVRANEVGEEVSKHYKEASSQLGQLADILVSDHGKLTDVRNDELLGINTKALKNLQTSAERGAQLWSYEALMPAAYEAIKLTPGEQNEKLSTAGEYICKEGEGAFSFPYRPFQDVTPPAELVNANLIGESSIGLLVRGGSKLPRNGATQVNPDVVPEKVLKPLVQGGATLGYYPDWFWHSAYGYPSSKTKSIGC